MWGDQTSAWHPACNRTPVASYITCHTPLFIRYFKLLQHHLRKVRNVSFVGELLVRTYTIVVVGPSTAEIAPPGYYILYLVHAGVPSPGKWVKVQ